MKKEDKNFLQNLQHEMLTQDNYGQADPRFWVVSEVERIYGVEEVDGYELMYKGEPVPETLEDIYDLLIDIPESKLSNCNAVIEYDAVMEKDSIKIKGYKDIKNSYDAYKFIKYDLGLDVGLIPYIDKRVIAPNTMFLTLRECKEHIKRNHYHYRKPLPYSMTAWRSPQVERLYKIIQDTDWD